MVVPVVVFFTRFKVGFQHGRFHMASFEPDCFTRCTNPQLVAKREQILCMTSCEFNELAAKHKVGPLLFATTSWSHKMNSKHQPSWEFSVSYTRYGVIVSRISPPAEQRNIFIVHVGWDCLSVSFVTSKKTAAEETTLVDCVSDG